MKSKFIIGKSLQQLRQEDEAYKNKNKNKQPDTPLKKQTSLKEIMRINKRTQYLIDMEFEP